MVADDVIAGARRGARSLRVLGWMREECESAAVEEVIRRKVTEPDKAWRVGRSAAIDELRRLTRHRGPRVHRAPFDDRQWPYYERGFEEVEAIDMLRARARERLTEREAEVIAHMVAGNNGIETAESMGVDPSRVTQLRRSAVQKMKWG